METVIEQPSPAYTVAQPGYPPIPCRLPPSPVVDLLKTHRFAWFESFRWVGGATRPEDFVTYSEIL